MYICVDFDGTVVDHRYPEIGSPAPGALIYLKKFIALNAKIILFTMRADGGSHGPVLSKAVEYLQKNGVQLYGVNRNPSQDSWTSSPKAFGHIYIDDAAVGCPTIHPPGFNRPCVDWAIVGPYIESILKKSGKKDKR